MICDRVPIWGKNLTLQLQFDWFQNLTETKLKRLEAQNGEDPRKVHDFNSTMNQKYLENPQSLFESRTLFTRSDAAKVQMSPSSESRNHSLVKRSTQGSNGTIRLPLPLFGDKHNADLFLLENDPIHRIPSNFVIKFLPRNGPKFCEDCGQHWFGSFLFPVIVTFAMGTSP